VPSLALSLLGALHKSSPSKAWLKCPKSLWNHSKHVFHSVYNKHIAVSAKEGVGLVKCSYIVLEKGGVYGSVGAISEWGICHKKRDNLNILVFSLPSLEKKASKATWGSHSRQLKDPWPTPHSGAQVPQVAKTAKIVRRAFPRRRLRRTVLPLGGPRLRVDEGDLPARQA
jgi:hypothetical protein